MATYMITYDLKDPGQNYDKLIKAIKEDCAYKWFSCWKSSYLLQSLFTIKQIYQKLEPYLDSNDKLIILEVTKNFESNSNYKELCGLYEVFK